MVEVLEVSHHRNGVSGRPFTVAIVRDIVVGDEMMEGEYLVVNFAGEPEETVCLSMADLFAHNVHMYSTELHRGGAAYRGDRVGYAVRDLVDAALRARIEEVDDERLAANFEQHHRSWGLRRCVDCLGEATVRCGCGYAYCEQHHRGHLDRISRYHAQSREL